VPRKDPALPSPKTGREKGCALLRDSKTEPPAAGRLAENIVYFGRALRAAGLPVGPGAVLDALAAVQAAGLGERGISTGRSTRCL